MRFDDRAIGRLRWLAREPVEAAGPVPGAIVAERYRIVRKLGEGGMGAVFEAENVLTGRAVALKVPHPRFCDDPAFRKRFLREARAASALSHPNVIDILDVVVDAEERPMIVMELLTGRSLAHLLRRRSRLTVAEAASLLVPVLDALDAAHARGVVHRDLKPENVFLAEDEAGCTVPKLLDFGIAKVAAGVEGGDVTGTITGTMLGTPCYMAPEQVSGMRDLDRKVDVWAAGAVLYECLAGRRPFAGDNFGQIFAAILESRPVALRELAPEVPESIEAAVSAALTRSRDQRPGSVTVLVEALEPFVEAGVRRRLGRRAPVDGAEMEASSAGAGPAGDTPSARAAMAHAATLSDPQLPGAAATGPKMSRKALGAVGVVVIAAIGTTVLASGGGQRAPSAAAPPPPTAAAAAIASGETPLPERGAAVEARVRIAPNTALVTVDGAPRAVNDGTVRLAGEPGDAFQVVVSDGTVRAEETVVLTRDGTATIEVIDLARGRPTPAVRPRPASRSASVPSAPPAAAPPPPTPAPTEPKAKEEWK